MLLNAFSESRVKVEQTLRDVSRFIARTAFYLCMKAVKSCGTSTAEPQSKVNIILIKAENLSFLNYTGNIVNSL